MTSKQYTGSVYIGVVGGENEVGECRDSIEHLIRRNGDSGPNFYRATKGYEARQKHLNKWYYETNHPFLFLMDHDMVFPPDALERLRRHGLPFVSGLYMRRRYAPIAPVWFKLPPKHTFPMEPWLEEPVKGQLHKIGASGWGCMLLHRDVVTATKPLLKGEPEIIEDDMDMWPYDLGEIVGAIQGLRALVDEAPKRSTLLPALEHHAETLEREIRPLRVIKDDIIGSDIRYPFFAREAGFQLYGDPDVRCAHMLNYPLTPDDFDQLPKETRQGLIKNVHRDVTRDRKTLREMVKQVAGER